VPEIVNGWTKYLQQKILKRMRSVYSKTSDHTKLINVNLTGSDTVYYFEIYDKLLQGF